MKKISTAAAKQTRNFQDQKLTIGLDLGDRSSWYCVLDGVGEVLLEQKLGTTPKAMKEVFGGMPRSRIALETGMHSPWVSRLLSELGHEVIVAHARNVRLIGESRKKDDRMDARTLARLVRIDPQLLAPVKHRSAQALADLMAIRARAGLVRARTSLVNTARGVSGTKVLRGGSRLGRSRIRWHRSISQFDFSGKHFSKCPFNASDGIPNPRRLFSAVNTAGSSRYDLQGIANVVVHQSHGP
jgi:hypothetical protein